MLVIEIKDKMWDGSINWKVIDVNMTLDDFTAMRKKLAEELPQFYSAGCKLEMMAGGASGFAMDLMHLLGWIEKNDARAMRKKARNVIVGHMQVLAPALIPSIATYYCRVTHVDGVKLKRRKCFQEQTYSKWLREQEADRCRPSLQ